MWKRGRSRWDRIRSIRTYNEMKFHTDFYQKNVAQPSLFQQILILIKLRSRPNCRCTRVTENMFMVWTYGCTQVLTRIRALCPILGESVHQGKLIYVFFNDDFFIVVIFLFLYSFFLIFIHFVYRHIFFIFIVALSAYSCLLFSLQSYFFLTFALPVLFDDHTSYW